MDIDPIKLISGLLVVVLALIGLIYNHNRGMIRTLFVKIDDLRRQVSKLEIKVAVLSALSKLKGDP